MLRATTYTYHGTTQLVHEMRNPLNELVERVTYDAATPPRVSQQTLHDGAQLVFQYAPSATTITTTGADGRVDVEEILYGANNAMVGRKLNGQSVLGSAFDTTFSPGTLRDGNNNTTATSFNANGQPLTTANALQQQTKRVYDSRSNFLETTDALGRTSDSYQNYVDGAYLTSAPNTDIRSQTIYDGVGRVKKTMGSYQDGIYSSGTPDRDILTTMSYDGLGRTTLVADVLNATTQTGYNGLDQTVVMTDTLGRVSRAGYDGTGTQRWQATPDGRVMLFQLDGLGRVVATVQNYQDGASTVGEPDRDVITRTVYDAAGRRTRAVDALGRVTAFAYDNRDRLITVTENYITHLTHQ